MKIILERKRAIPGSHHFYEATIKGPEGEDLIQVTEKTKVKAKALAFQTASDILKNYSKRAHYPTPGGNHLFEVSFRHGGWGYQIINIKTGKQGCSASVGGSFEETCAAAKSHADNYGV